MQEPDIVVSICYPWRQEAGRSQIRVHPGQLSEIASQKENLERAGDVAQYMGPGFNL